MYCVCASFTLVIASFSPHTNLNTMFTTLDYAYVNCLDDSDKRNSKRDSAGLPLSEHFPSRVTRSVTKQTQSVLSTHSRKKGMFGYTNSVQDPIGIEYKYTLFILGS